MGTSGIFFSGNDLTAADLVNDAKRLERIEVLLPIYHLENHIVRGRQKPLLKVQEFKKELERINLFSNVQCELLETAIKFNCYIKERFDDEGMALEEIVQVYNLTQPQVFAVFYSWNIFDIQERIHVHVFTKKKGN